MSEIELLLMEKLAAKATPADTDTMIVAEGNVLKKSTISQLVTFLKEKLGINSLNTKMNDYVTIKNFVQKITLKSGIATVNINAALDGYILLGIVRCSFASSYLTTTGYTLSGNNLSLNVQRRFGTYDFLSFGKLLCNSIVC